MRDKEKYSHDKKHKHRKQGTLAAFLWKCRESWIKASGYVQY